MRITGRVITYNEEQQIGATVAALLVVCDEVLVIDSFSTDQTVSVARAAGARVAEHAFEGYGMQKNFGDLQAKYDYILSVDADEVLSPELQQSILAVKKSDAQQAYSFNILTHIGGQPIRSCGLYPDRHVRLYDRRRARWSERDVHEELTIQDKVEILRGDLLHYSYKDFSDLQRKTEYYARMGAAVYKKRAAPVLIYNMLVNPLAKFIKVYFLQKGFTDGFLGFGISYERMRETFLKYYWALI